MLNYAARLTGIGFSATSTSYRRSHIRNLATKVSKPLRILFCGSDQFSCASLSALDAERKANPGLIESIDVLIRPGKKSGQGLKKIREVPLKSVATQLELKLHERDTFTGWQLPKSNEKPINLIIAVSFGLFVPPRILNGVEYGGLNVHPSLLPQFRGPAPLQHTLLTGQTHMGVTVQTLDAHRFDYGIILAQTPPPGFEIPNASRCTYDQLLQFIAPKAADLLVHSIRERHFVDPHQDVGWCRGNETGGELKHAPKITTEDRRVKWNLWTASSFVNCMRAIGRPWTLFKEPRSGETKRINFEDCEVSTFSFDKDEAERGNEGSNPAEVDYFTVVDDSGHCVDVKFMVQDEAIHVFLPAHVLSSASNSCKQVLKIKEVTVEGGKKVSAISVFRKRNKLKLDD